MENYGNDEDRYYRYEESEDDTWDYDDLGNEEEYYGYDECPIKETNAYNEAERQHESLWYEKESDTGEYEQEDEYKKDRSYIITRPEKANRWNVGTIWCDNVKYGLGPESDDETEDDKWIKDKGRDAERCGGSKLDDRQRRKEAKGWWTEDNQAQLEKLYQRIVRLEKRINKTDLECQLRGDRDDVGTGSATIRRPSVAQGVTKKEKMRVGERMEQYGQATMATYRCRPNGPPKF